MKAFIKTCLMIFACGLYVSAIATNRFIIKYKPNESQTSFLLAHGGADENKAKTEMMEKISNEKIDTLSKAVGIPGVQARDSHPLATGAHVIILSKYLDEKQTEQFISTVKQDNSVEYIEEDKRSKALSVPAVNPTYQWDMTNLGEFAAQPTWNGDNFVNAWNTLNSYSCQFPCKIDPSRA
ncbi:hypothetical protein GAMM_40286 [Gammaproteobacteria bacterium]